MSKEDEGNTLFPIFLKLRQLNTLIVGGGYVGLEKLEALLKNDDKARVTIIGITVSNEIKKLASNRPQLRIKERAFEPDDLYKRDLVIVATDVYETNKFIKESAQARNVLCNVADTPPLCDFYLGSTVKKGDLKVGISTNGKSPTFSKRFREVLEEVLPDDTNELLQNLKIIRDRLKGDFGQKVTELNKITENLVKKINFFCRDSTSILFIQPFINKSIAHKLTPCFEVG